MGIIDTVPEGSMQSLIHHARQIEVKPEVPELCILAQDQRPLGDVMAESRRDAVQPVVSSLEVVALTY